MFKFFGVNKLFSITYRFQKYVFFLFVVYLSEEVVEELRLSQPEYLKSDSVRRVYGQVLYAGGS